MTVDEMVDILPGSERVGRAWQDAHARLREVTGVAYHSEHVRPGAAFACIRGERHDGHDFAPQAAGRGAALIVGERPLPGVQDAVCVAVVPDARVALGLVAAAYYGHPDRGLRLTGVTGTSGKTTTTYLVKAALEGAGHRVGLIGTIRNLVGDEEVAAERTTPESADLHRMLSEMAARGVGHVVTEVSSHAVALRRLSGVEYDVGVFTNLSHDHLDFHGTMEAYRQAKGDFFSGLVPGHKGRKLAVLNADDSSSAYMASRSAAPVVRFGRDTDADVVAESIDVAPEGVSFTARSPWGSGRVRLRLGGSFNVYNALAALAVALFEGVPFEAAARGMEKLEGVDGRFEAVREGQGFSVIVDYAHKPDALEKVLRACRATRPRAIWVVFGCGGDRDRAKRPVMGAIAARLADRVVITSDNPRSEDPEAICKAIEEGVREALRAGPVSMTSYEVQVDRREAIRIALGQAEPGDLVLIAGKGHEAYQVFGDRTVHFDDREVAREVLRSLGYQGEEASRGDRQSG